MRVADIFPTFDDALVQQLKLSYQELQNCGLDLGFSSKIVNNKDIHIINRDVVVSFMYFHNGGLTNVLFNQKQPIYLDYNDEITSYYSDYIEIRYLLAGNLEVEIEGKTAHFKEGEICLINSMAYHKESIPNSECLLVNISIQKDLFTEAFLDKVSLTPLRKFLRKNILRYSDEQNYITFSSDSNQQNDQIQEYLYQIIHEAINMEAGYIDICKGYITRLMSILSEGYHFGFNKKEIEQYTQNLFDTVSNYMKDNIRTVNMEALSREFHYQPNYFNLLIKRYTGKTYSDYLIYLRLEQAKQYLSNSNIPIDEIMYLVGYNNKGFFYKKFEENTGITPSKYRKGLKTKKEG